MRPKAARPRGHTIDGDAARPLTIHAECLRKYIKVRGV